jgi:demethylmenaquinone methyltransferase/2-methoxy-6-polyprenyl-1,4-benzoquinol methylase
MALDASRDRAVRSMFDGVAPRYDLLNRVISFRLDNHWRKAVVAAALRAPGDSILDVGSGTGDLSFAAAEARPGKIKVTGLDFSLQMLRRAQQKKGSSRHRDTVRLVQGSALFAPFKPAVFDSVVSAFVLRNVSDLPAFFAEAERVLKPGGSLVTLDMFPPRKSWFSPLYALYFYRLVPWIGRIISPEGNAYRYLSESVRAFHSPETISRFIAQARLENVSVQRFLSGAVCMHSASKPI